jgi:putative methylase
LGKTVRRRLVRKRNLEIALSKVEAHPTPKAYLEQYTIPASIAAEILYIAAYVNGDIIQKRIVDLGCGTGKLAIGTALLGAKEVVGVDIDKTAVKLAWKNATKLGVKDKTQWLIADIDAIHGAFDTVLQNPPFGVRKRKADRKFLQKSLEIAYRVYSLHKGKSSKELVRRLEGHRTQVVRVHPSAFLENFIDKHGGKIRAVYVMVMTIPYMFKFHRKRKHQFLVYLYIIETKCKERY